MAKKSRPKKLTRPPRADTDALLEAIQAELGSHGVVIQRGHELEGRFDLRRPCGIPSLDIDTGGGLPAGGLSQIDGPDGSGKNMLAYRYAGQIQRLYGDDTNVFMLCMEFPFDKAYARYHGFKVPLSNYEIDVEQRRRQEKGEELLTKAEIAEMQDNTGLGTFHVLRGPAEANLDAVVEMIRSNSYQLGIIDSWDSMLTAPEEEKDLADDAKVASASGIQTRWMKKVQGALTPRKRCPDCYNLDWDFKKFQTGNYSYYCSDKKCGWKGKKPYLEENETTVIGIRQVRANLNRRNMRSPEFKVGGAWALKHGKLVDIQLRPGERIMSPDGKVKLGKEINYEITKGKAGTHEGKKGSFRYYFGPPEVDVDHNFLTAGTTAGIIRRGGSVYYIDRDDGETLKYSGKRELLDAIAEEAEVKNIIWRGLLAHADLMQVRHRDAE
jgi:RecA/RadA recombinase